MDYRDKHPTFHIPNEKVPEANASKSNKNIKCRQSADLIICSGWDLLSLFDHSRGVFDLYSNFNWFPTWLVLSDWLPEGAGKVRIKLIQKSFRVEKLTTLWNIPGALKPTFRRNFSSKLLGICKQKEK